MSQSVKFVCAIITVGLTFAFGVCAMISGCGVINEVGREFRSHASSSVHSSELPMKVSDSNSIQPN